MKMITAALAALMMTSAVPALAESAFMTANHELRASKLVGVTVTNRDNGTIGTIDDVLISPTGKAAEAVVKLEDGDKLVEVPLSHLKFDGASATMAASQAQLSAMRTYSYRMASDSHG